MTVTRNDLLPYVNFLRTPRTMDEIAAELCLSERTAPRWLVYIETRLGLTVKRGKDSKKRGQRMRYWIDTEKERV